VAQAQAQTNGNKEHVLRELQRHAVAIYLSEIGTDIERHFGLRLGVDSDTLTRVLVGLVKEGQVVVWFDDDRGDIGFLPRSTWSAEARQLVRGLDLERAQELRRELSELEQKGAEILNRIQLADVVDV